MTPADAAPRSSRPLRFCMLSTFYPPWSFGGDGIQVQRLAHALADRGHAVTVVCAPAAYRLHSSDPPRPSHGHPGVEVVPLRGGSAALVGRYLSGRPVGARRQLRALLESGFDVIHHHNPSLLGAPALLGMGSGVKLYTAHEQWLLCPSHVLLRRDGSVCEAPPCWSCELAHRRPPQPWRRTGLLERSLEHLDALIVPSRVGAALHRRFAERVRLEMLPHFAPASASAKGPHDVDRSGLPSMRPYFLYVGRLEPIKGVEGLLDAFRGRREGLVIAGDGGLERRLRRRARGLQHVHFAGWLSGGQLDRVYSDALAVLIPTRGHEAMSLVALEAFARGAPVIARHFGALGDLAERTGAAISYRSAQELEAALNRVASEPVLRRRLAERGRRAAAGSFSVDAHLRSYLSLIAGIARDRGDGELAAAAEAAAPIGSGDVPGGVA